MTRAKYILNAELKYNAGEFKRDYFHSYIQDITNDPIIEHVWPNYWTPQPIHVIVDAPLVTLGVKGFEMTGEM